MTNLFDIVVKDGLNVLPKIKNRAGYDLKILDLNVEKKQFIGVVYYRLPNKKTFSFQMVWDEFGNSIEREKKPWHYYLGLKYVK